MKQVKLLMTILLASALFAACSSDDDPVPALKFDPAAVEVVVEGDAATVTVSEGTAPYTIVVAEVEEGADVIEATIDEEGKITISGVAEGTSTITVTDANGVKGEIEVTVTAKDEEGDDTEGEGEGDTEGDA